MKTSSSKRKHLRVLQARSEVAFGGSFLHRVLASLWPCFQRLKKGEDHGHKRND
jgi:hypothetical protein